MARGPLIENNSPFDWFLEKWEYQLRDRLISALRRPWSVGFLLLFTAIACGGVDLGLGISNLRLDNPALLEFSPQSASDWVVLLLNSAAFWTGLMAAASIAVVSSFVVYEWNIAPRRTEVHGVYQFQFMRVNLLKCFDEFAAMWAWLLGIFSVLWVISILFFPHGYRELMLSSIVRYAIGVAVGIVVFGLAVRCAFGVLANLRGAFNGEDRQRPPPAPPPLQAALRQNLAGLILFSFVFLSSVILVQLGAVIPIASIFLVLLIVYSGFKMLVYFTTISRWVIVVFTGVWLVFAGPVTGSLGLWSGPDSYAEKAFFNLQFPGFRTQETDFYQTPVDISSANPYAAADRIAAEKAGETKENKKPNLQESVGQGQFPAERFADWAAAYWNDNKRRPVLVVISTSGGAYRAGFWTGFVLDRFLEEAARPDSPFADLPESIRLITGASGGMVGASYFATRPADQPEWRIITRLEQDILCAQMTDEELAKREPGVCPGAKDDPYRIYPTRIPAPRQTLSAVAQHTLQHDLPSIFWGGRTEVDRGKVLEGQWLHLNKPIAFLGEEAFRPAMVFSPMIVESGQQLLISDMNLSGIEPVVNGEAVELLSHFRGVRDTLAIRTAVRMQATFPYISPAVSLPTTESNRVVDAGYYDNYGLVTATAVLGGEEVMRAVQTDYAAVLVIEVRAFPDTLEKTRSENDMAFDWVTTPLEAILSARGNSMNFRNRQVLRELKERYRGETGFNAGDGGRGPMKIPVHRLVFTNCTETDSLNWFVPREELEQMRKSAKAEWERNSKHLKNIWQRDPAAAADPIWGEGSLCQGGEAEKAAGG